MAESLVSAFVCPSCQHQWTERDLPKSSASLCSHCAMPGELLKIEARPVDLEAEAKDYHFHKLRDAAQDLHDFLWLNVPELIDISTSSEMAGEGLRKRLQALKEALK